MSSDIKKLLSILDESTTAGSVASVSSKVGGSPLKRSKDTIFAAENSDQTECATDTTSSPSNFGLWKNSASLSTEQRNKHGRKHSTVDRSVMYPQLGESSQREQGVIDSTRSARQSSERNAGLNEPDELPSGDDKYSDLGTWHFKYDDGRVVMKDGKPLLTTSKKNAKDIVDRASKAGHTIEIVGGAPSDLRETYKNPKNMDEFNDDDWAEWDAKVGRVGDRAKKKAKLDRHYNNIMGTSGLSDGAKKQTTDIYNKLKENEGVAEGFSDQATADELKAASIAWAEFARTADGQAERDRANRMSLKYKALSAAASDREMKQRDQGVAEGNPGYNKHSFVGRIRRGREADNKGWEQLGNLFAAGNDKKAAEKALRKGNRYYNMTRGSNRTPGGFPKTTFEGVAEGSEITEEMIADRLKDELALFKSGTKAKDKAISGKPADKEVQPKKSTKKASDEDK